jgi:acyl carrier protein
MPDDNLDPSFERLLRRVVPWPADEHLTLDLDLLGAGLDSLGAVRLLTEIQATYDVVIPDEALLGDIFTTPSDLWNLVCELRGQV